jgi:prepilin-type N-terminal cleavage/methylation domain-containing protein
MHAMTRGREGFTLVEMLMVVVLLVPLWSIAIGLATASARAAARASALASGESAVGQATAILAAELGDVAAGAGVLLIEPDLIRIHASRGVGRWCLADTAGVVIATAEWAASRVPVAGRDSVVMERVATDSSGWRELLRLGLTGAPASEECAPGVPGLRLPVNAGARLPAGAAARAAGPHQRGHRARRLRQRRADLVRDPPPGAGHPGGARHAAPSPRAGCSSPG